MSKTTFPTPQIRPKLLDDGCGNGFWWYLFLANKFQIIGIDISFTQIKRARLRHHEIEVHKALIGDVRKLPLKKESVDMVLSSEVVEHLLPGEERFYLEEAHRVLKPGGWVILTTPNALELRRVFQNVAVKLISAALGVHPENLKARVFRTYVYLTGHAGGIEAIEKSGFVGHFNVMSVGRLTSAFVKSGFEVVEVRPIIVMPVIAWPFKKGRWIPKIFLVIESLLQRLPLVRWCLLGGMAFLCKKV